MANLTTYSDIQAAVQSVSEDTSQEYLDYYPTALHLAELRLQKELDTVGLKQNTNISTVIGQRTIDKPSGFRYTHDMFLYDPLDGSETPLKHVSDDYLRDYWPIATNTLKPRYYAQDYDNSSFLLAPTPDKVYTVRVSMGADITPLSSTNTTNYFSLYCSEALYYATMVEMAIFGKHSGMKQDFEEKYTSAREALNNQGRRQRRDDGFAPNNPSGGQNTLKGEK